MRAHYHQLTVVGFEGECPPDATPAIHSPIFEVSGLPNARYRLERYEGNYAHLALIDVPLSVATMTHRTPASYQCVVVIVGGLGRRLPIVATPTDADILLDALGYERWEKQINPLLATVDAYKRAYDRLRETVHLKEVHEILNVIEEELRRE